MTPDPKPENDNQDEEWPAICVIEIDPETGEDLPPAQKEEAARTNCPTSLLPVTIVGGVEAPSKEPA